jgi:hypothetical protein
VPGFAVGAGVAVTGGVNLFPPDGSIDFCVGDTDVVVGVVLDGLGDSLLPQPAVSAPIAMSALPPTANASRRAKRPEFMIVLSVIASAPQMFADDRGMASLVNMMPQVPPAVCKFRCRIGGLPNPAKS